MIHYELSRWQPGADRGNWGRDGGFLSVIVIESMRY